MNANAFHAHLDECPFGLCPTGRALLLQVERKIAADVFRADESDLEYFLRRKAAHDSRN